MSSSQNATCEHQSAGDEGPFSRSSKLSIQLMTRRDLAEAGISYSNAHLLKLESEGRFPRRVTLSPAKVCWIRSEVESWIEAKAAERLSANSA